MSVLFRRLVPYSLLPLAMLGVGLASSPWLRAFPYGVLAVSLFGAAVLSVLVPFIVYGIGVKRLWLGAVIDVALWLFYELLVTLRAPGGFDQLYHGLVHGPAQLLTYTLPLVSPRSLLVAPIALCWLSGALIGETIARGWHSVLPYVSLVVVFGLAYAATIRGITSTGDGHRYDILLAVALLLTILLTRTAQTWIEQNESAQSTQPDGVLPLRGLAIGTAVALFVSLGATGIAETSWLKGPPTTPSRQPPIDSGRPLTPLSFIAGLRPSDPASKGKPVFTVSTDGSAQNYISIASVDTYDGDGWTFAAGRTFRPTGGVIPLDTDTTLHTIGPTVTQQYSLPSRSALTGSPWMPYMYRPSQVSGLSVDIDSDSGMVVPDARLRPRATYTMQSDVAATSLERLKTPAVGGYSQIDQQRPANVTSALTNLIDSLHSETHTTTSTPAVAFLQAVADEFRTRDSLAGDKSTAPSTSPTSPKPGSSTSGSVAAPSPGSAAQRGNGTSFADVLASIRQFRSATPEQYATLMCLIARQIGVPARVATGFRIPPPQKVKALPAGTYRVTTADAWTWVEIPIVGQGWMVLDPSPSTYTAQRPLQSSSQAAAASPTASPTPNARITQANNGHGIAPKSKVPDQRKLSTTSLVTIIVVCVAIVLALFVLFLFLRKRLRTRRRRRIRDPRLRLVGAWQESLDLLEEAGLPDLTGFTGREVSMATDYYFGSGPAATVRTIGDAANAAIFSEEIATSEQDAEATWTAYGTLKRSVRRRQRWHERVRSRLRYHRAGPGHPTPGPRTWFETAELERQRAAAAGRRGAHR